MCGIKHMGIAIFYFKKNNNNDVAHNLTAIVILG